MSLRYQLVLDCADPDRLCRFWAEALHYVIAPPPAGFDSWDEYWRAEGLPEEDLNIGEDRIIDPEGGGPAIWFQKVPEPKSIKNRWHVDVRASGDPDLSLAERTANVEAEAARLVALGAIRVRSLEVEGFDHYAVAMLDPEGNEFDIN